MFAGVEKQALKLGDLLRRRFGRYLCSRAQGFFGPGLFLQSTVTLSFVVSDFNAGGIFGPSLFIGAMLGGSVGALANWLLPTYILSS